MSEKRKYEDLLDPDYPQNAKLAKTAAFSATTAAQRDQPSTSSGLTGEERIERIRAILKREFQQATADKEQEILEIDNRIHLARKLLHRVRYAVVADYYNRKGLELPDAEAEKCVASLGLKSTAPMEQDRGPQRAIHPALRNILGKQSEVDFDEILRSRPTREAARTAITSIKEKLRTKKEEKRLQRAMRGLTNTVTSHENSAMLKIPRHIEPRKREHKIPQLNIARGRNQTKHLIAVGNTSKYVGDERNATDEVTHKWLVYVKTKTAVPIEKILTKVRFFLHPSYRPNDIVEVCEPPFQLSRRGWGEFPIRLQLFFEPSLQQKPVQLFHNLVLDKTNCGLQTMGSETVVEIWLRTEQPSTVTKDDESSASDDGNSNDQFEDNLMEFLNRIENRTSKSLCEEEKIEPTISIPTDTEPAFAGIERHATLRNSLKCSSSQAVCTTTSGDLSREIKREKEAAEEQLATNRSTPNVLIQPIKQEPPVDIPYEPFAKPSSIVEEALKVPNKEIAKSSSLSSTGSISRTPTVINIKPVVQTSTQNIVMGNHVKGTLVKVVPKPTVVKPANLPPNQLQFFEKRRIKCIDKEGNVKFVDMLVKATNLSNGQSKPAAAGLPSSGTVTIQKPIVLTKINGQTKPVVLKVAPTNPIKSLTPTSSIKSPTATNSIATNLSPPAIPNTSQPINQTPSLPKSLGHSTNNKVLVKNGKLCLIDPHKKPKLKQSARKQESLLKPQVSLLKPIVKNDNLTNCMRNDAKTIFNHTAIATDHDYTSPAGKSPSHAKVTIYKPTNPTGIGCLLHKQKSSIVTVNSPNNSRINVIVTKLDDDDDDEEYEKVAENRTASEIRLSLKPGLTHRSVALMQKPRKDFQQELKSRFEKSKMLSVRQAIEFLLKHLPLVDMRAANIDYSVAFPFVVKSQDAFDRLTTPKLKAFEWLRAKYIQQLLPKHPELIESASSFWTTKEIVIFARLHAYTPVINYKSTTNATAPDTAANTEADNSLKDLIKKEIKREKYDIETVTLVHDAYDWINTTRQKIDRELDVRNEIIDVDGLNEDENLNGKRLSKNATQSPLKDMQGKYFHPLDASREPELKLVNEACQDIGIRLKPEEILPDVMHPSVQLVLVQSLRCFLGDLMRRAAAVCSASNVASPLVENITIRPDDIRNAILGRSQWDFLTNDSLGVAKPKESAID